MKDAKKTLEAWQIEDAARLKTLYNERKGKISQEEFGSRYEIGSQGMVWQYLNARRPLNIEAAAAFARGLGIDVASFSPKLAAKVNLLTSRLVLPSLNSPEAHARRAEEEMEEERRDWEAEESRQRGLHTLKEAGYQPTDDEFALVPQLDVEIACGDGKFVDHVVVKGGLAFKRSSLKDFGVTEKTARIIYAAGGSMTPTIQDGCVVLINTADITPREGKVYAICMPEGGLVLKRLIRDYHPSIGGHVWIMRSDNPDKISHPDKMLPPDDRTMIAGRAIWNDNRL